MDRGCPPFHVFLFLFSVETKKLRIEKHVDRGETRETAIKSHTTSTSNCVQRRKVICPANPSNPLATTTATTMTTMRCAAEHGKAFYLFLFTFYGMQFEFGRSLAIHDIHFTVASSAKNNELPYLYLLIWLLLHDRSERWRSREEIVASFFFCFIVFRFDARTKALNFRTRSLKNLLCARFFSATRIIKVNFYP